MIFILPLLLIIVITKLIYEVLSVLLIEEASVNTTILNNWRFRGINYRPLNLLLICYYKRLFSFFVSSSFRLITWATKKRLNKDFNWYIEVIYTPLAY
jgi:hypothetical protein